MSEELLQRPAAELAAMVRDRACSPRELAELALRRIESVDPELGAFVEVDAERTLAEADAVRPGEQPFAGVPLAIKANVPAEGRRFDYCSAFLDGHRADHDAFLVRRLREAGFVIAGMTKLPEFGILPTTEPVHQGPARNPWDPSRTPGGSSGGSAAAVAAGMVPLAHGNDGGGSIRIPAACCGLVGLKPSRGRISRGPDLGDSPLSVEGMLTRTVGDTAVTLDPECERGLRAGAELLAELGHEVVEEDPELSGAETLQYFTAVFGGYIALSTLHAETIRGRAPEEGEIEPLSAALRDLAGNVHSFHYLAALTRLQQLARQLVADVFTRYDLLLTPALAERPLPIGECHGCGDRPLEDFARSAAFTPYTALFNVTGQPAISLPVDLGPDGLPTCIQLVGRPVAEEVLLQVAAQVEEARPWAHRLPPPAARPDGP